MGVRWAHTSGHARQSIEGAAVRSLRRLVLPTALAVLATFGLAGPVVAAPAASLTETAAVSSPLAATKGHGGDYETALYVYKKRDGSKNASWSNSGKQYLVKTWTGRSWAGQDSLTASDLADVPGPVCGDGWGVQQDAVDLNKVKGDEPFLFPENIQYPTDNIGWPPIIDAGHWELSELMDVPNCTSDLPDVPTVDVTPPTCEAPTNTVTVDGMSKDIRVEFGDVTVLSEDISDGVFDVEAALEERSIEPFYGDVDVRVVWTDSKGDTKDHELDTFTLNVIDPASLDCDTRTPATPVAPEVAACEAEMPGIVLPQSEQFTYSFDEESGVVTATVQDGFKASVGDSNWTMTDVEGVLTRQAENVPGFDVECAEPEQPTLEGSVATGICEADAPWLNYTITLTDPDGIYEGDRTATITFVAPEGEEDVVRNVTLGEDGTVSDKALWPGASVDADGNADGWPGWELVGGTWTETTGNFAWARDLTQVRFDVNPALDVDVTYPVATPDCAAAPPMTEPTTDPTTEPTVMPTDGPTTDVPTATESADDSEVLGASVPPEDELASTGASVLLWALAALGLIGGGLVTVVMVRRRQQA